MKNLWVVMPVYNEKECIGPVVKEWIPTLRQYAPGFTLCVLNDGSKDNTLSILRDLQKEYPELRVVDKPNSGHGQSCLEGYRLAIKEGADFIFQIDSDGQCDPQYFQSVVDAADSNKVVYGFRKSRDDGWKRWVISRIVSLFAWVATGVWVRDANVPYRMMHSETLSGFVDKIPSDFHLANILVSVLQQKHFGIHWVNIHFRDRIGGSPSVKSYSFFKHGLKLFRQLRASYSGIR